MLNSTSNPCGETKGYCLELTETVVRGLRSCTSPAELSLLLDAVSGEMGFRHYALIHHGDLGNPHSGLIDLKDYPTGTVQRLFGDRRYRRDPVIRACIFAESAFLWSDLSQIIALDRLDRSSLELGAREGLNEGITVPCFLLGDCMGSCTFAGARAPERAEAYLGAAQMIGVFAFQSARRIWGRSVPSPAGPPKLHPRPRHCIILAGRGYSNKEIARALALTPRTVDGYLTEARRLFDAHDRTELVVSAVLAGEIGLHEIRRQPE